MERDGLIERKPSPTDRRAFHIYLTDKGKRCEPMVKAAASQLNQSLLQSVSTEEQTHIQSYLQRLIDNLEENWRLHDAPGISFA